MKLCFLIVVFLALTISIQAQTKTFSPETDEQQVKKDKDYYESHARSLKDSPLGQKFRDTGQLGRLQQANQEALEAAFAEFSNQLPPVSATDPRLTGCVVLMTRYDGLIMSRCAGIENKALGFDAQPSWKWPVGLSGKPGTQFYYQQVDKCRIVFSPSDVEDADSCNARKKAAPYCEQ